MTKYWIFSVFLLAWFVLLPTYWNIIRFFKSPEKNKTKYFKDKSGRVIIYHGVNLCNYSKWAPGNLPWHTLEDYRKLKEYGFNLVRFLIFWEAIEPKKGEFDLVYIENVKKHLTLLNSLGIHVMLDLHQDLYNKKFGGNGFPDWTLPSKDIPYKSKEKWFLNYFHKAVRTAYNSFWKNDTLITEYINLIKFVKDQFNDCPNVIGLDIMNEPFPVLKYLPWFEKFTLTKFYKTIEYSLQDNKYNFNNFYEPMIWGSTGIPTGLNKLEISIAGCKGYIPHYYPPFGHNSGSTYGAISRFFTKYGLRSKAREAQEFRSPYIMGEFGIESNVKNREEGIIDFCNRADEYLMSWCWWAYDKIRDSSQGLLDDLGNPNDTMKLLQRPFPQRIAGSNPKFSIEKDTIIIEFFDNFGIMTPTEVYIPGKVISIYTNTIYYTNTTVNLGNNSLLKFYNKDLGTQSIKIVWQSM